MRSLIIIDFIIIKICDYGNLFRILNLDVRISTSLYPAQQLCSKFTQKIFKIQDKFFNYVSNLFTKLSKVIHF